MFGQKIILVIWVAARQLTIMGGKLTAPQSIVLPENVVSDLEVVDHDALYALIKTWTEQHPAMGAEIIWIFGPDTYFEHTMQDTEKSEWDTVVVRFLDLLPFEEVESRVYTTATTTKVVAINKDLYVSLKRGFALQGYVTRAEVVSSEINKPNGAQSMSQAVVAYVAKNLTDIEKNRVVNDDVDTTMVTLDTTQPAKKKSQLPLLLGVFGVLLAILGYMVVTML